eukprot:jgi/Bigna1/76100/fgenesh1_pg.39_\
MAPQGGSADRRGGMLLEWMLAALLILGLTAAVGKPDKKYPLISGSSSSVGSFEDRGTKSSSQESKLHLPPLSRSSSSESRRGTIHLTQDALPVLGLNCARVGQNTTAEAGSGTNGEAMLMIVAQGQDTLGITGEETHDIKPPLEAAGMLAPTIVMPVNAGGGMSSVMATAIQAIKVKQSHDEIFFHDIVISPERDKGLLKCNYVIEFAYHLFSKGSTFRSGEREHHREDERFPSRHLAMDGGQTGTATPTFPQGAHGEQSEGGGGGRSILASISPPPLQRHHGEGGRNPAHADVDMEGRNQRAAAATGGAPAAIGINAEDSHLSSLPNLLQLSNTLKSASTGRYNNRLSLDGEQLPPPIPLPDSYSLAEIRNSDAKFDEFIRKLEDKSQNGIGDSSGGKETTLGRSEIFSLPQLQGMGPPSSSIGNDQRNDNNATNGSSITVDEIFNFGLGINKKSLRYNLENRLMAMRPPTENGSIYSQGTPHNNNNNNNISSSFNSTYGDPTFATSQDALFAPSSSLSMDQQYNLLLQQHDGGKGDSTDAAKVQLQLTHELERREAREKTTVKFLRVVHNRQRFSAVSNVSWEHLKALNLLNRSLVQRHRDLISLQSEIPFNAQVVTRLPDIFALRNDSVVIAEKILTDEDRERLGRQPRSNNATHGGSGSSIKNTSTKGGERTARSPASSPYSTASLKLSCGALMRIRVRGRIKDVRIKTAPINFANISAINGTHILIKRRITEPDLVQLLWENNTNTAHAAAATVAQQNNTNATEYSSLAPTKHDADGKNGDDDGDDDYKIKRKEMIRSMFHKITVRKRYNATVPQLVRSLGRGERSASSVLGLAPDNRTLFYESKAIPLRPAVSSPQPSNPPQDMDVEMDGGGESGGDQIRSNTTRDSAGGATDEARNAALSRRDGVDDAKAAYAFDAGEFFINGSWRNVTYTLRKEYLISFRGARFWVSADEVFPVKKDYSGGGRGAAAAAGGGRVRRGSGIQGRGSSGKRGIYGSMQGRRRYGDSRAGGSSYRPPASYKRRLFGHAQRQWRGGDTSRDNAPEALDDIIKCTAFDNMSHAAPRILLPPSFEERMEFRRSGEQARFVPGFGVRKDDLEKGESVVAIRNSRGMREGDTGTIVATSYGLDDERRYHVENMATRQVVLMKGSQIVSEREEEFPEEKVLSLMNKCRYGLSCIQHFFIRKRRRIEGARGRGGGRRGERSSWTGHRGSGSNAGWNNGTEERGEQQKGMTAMEAPALEE